MAATTGVGLAAAGLPSSGQAQAAVASEDTPNVIDQPAPTFADDLNTADIVVETLIAWGATHAFGVVGDGINAIIEALRKRQDRIRYIGVRRKRLAATIGAAR